MHNEASRGTHAVYFFLEKLIVRMTQKKTVQNLIR